MKKLRILIVDDELNVRRLLSKILSKNGYETFTASDGLEGLEFLANNDADIIISDIKMPNMDGIEFLHNVKDKYPHVGFILITAFATTETAIDALKSGAQDYVTKPFDIDELLNSVKKLDASIQQRDCTDLSEQVNYEDVKTHSNSAAMQEVIQLSKRVAQSDSTVLINGETGTGKEVLATAIHNWSKRADKTIIKVNCGAIPDNLLESELFGYEKGAFTGAITSKPGRFEIADGGTIFLDEIGDITPSLQVKLLRVLQEKTFERLGGISSISVDVRVIAATNRDLKKEVELGNFREDLYYRLNVVPIKLPALRERREDIGDLIKFFLKKSASYSSTDKVKTVSLAAMEKLMSYGWPGNIRELENLIERCVVITPGDVIDLESLPAEVINYCSDTSNNESEPDGEVEHALSTAIDEKEREVIVRVLEENNGNKSKAALCLGISRRSLYRKIQKYMIE